MMGVGDARRRANEHARRTCKNVDGVFWKGADLPCFYCGCEGSPAIPPSPKNGHTYVAEDDMTRWGRAA